MAIDIKVLQIVDNIDIIISSVMRVKLDIRDRKIPSDSPIIHDIDLHNYLKMNTLFEELKKLHAHGKDEYVRKVLYCIEPIMTFAKKYERAAYVMRNGVVAHLNRDSKDQYAPYWHRIKSLEDTPQTHEELEIIWGAFDVIRVILINQFPELIEFRKEGHADMMKTIEDLEKEAGAPKLRWEKAILKDTVSRLIEKGFAKDDSYFQEIPDTR